PGKDCLYFPIDPICLGTRSLVGRLGLVELGQEGHVSRIGAACLDGRLPRVSGGLVRGVRRDLTGPGSLHPAFALAGTALVLLSAIAVLGEQSVRIGLQLIWIRPHAASLLVRASRAAPTGPLLGALLADSEDGADLVP